MTLPAELEAVLHEACAAVGLSAEGAQPIRLGENAIFRLPDAVVVRISRPGQQAAARREVAVSQWLNASGIAAVEVVAGVNQPVERDGRSVTFWEALPPHQHGSLTQVATVLRQLHRLPVPHDMSLSTLNPFVRLGERIESAVTIPVSDRAWLRARLTDLQAQWKAVAPELPTCAIHGDAWAGNVIATNDGRVVMLDLERCSIGPREWDLVSSAVKYVTYGAIDGDEYRRFYEAYGLDVTRWDGFTLLRDIRELRMTCYVAQQAATQERFRREAAFRIACLQGKRGIRPWAWTPAE